MVILWISDHWTIFMVALYLPHIYHIYHQISPVCHHYRQEYGQITRMLGNGRCDVQCVDGVKRYLGCSRATPWFLRRGMKWEREREPPNLCLIYWGKWWNMMEHYGKCWFTMRFRGTLNISGNCSFPLIASHFAHRKLMSLRLCHIRGRSGRSIHAAIRGVRKR